MDLKRKILRQPARVDHLLIAEMVKPGARVLDVGCGDGELLSLLEAERDVDGRGIELSQSNVNLCVAKGLSVIQGDADRDLANYPDSSFDYAILSQTLQATRRPRRVMEQLLRIGRRAIVSFPNFGHWRIRLQFLAGGRMPVTPTLPDSWYETPNIHYCTIKDFLTLCEDMQAKFERSVALNAYGTQIGKGLRMSVSWQNVIGEQAVFLLTKSE
jgi:methionine biosynthesis protein MetW